MPRRILIVRQRNGGVRVLFSFLNFRKTKYAHARQYDGRQKC